MYSNLRMELNNSFVNLPLLCEKSGAILLVLMGLMAGRQSDKILVDLEILNFLLIASLGFSWGLTRYSVIMMLPMHFSQFFQVKRCAL